MTLTSKVKFAARKLFRIFVPRTFLIQIAFDVALVGALDVAKEAAKESSMAKAIFPVVDAVMRSGEEI